MNLENNSAYNKSCEVGPVIISTDETPRGKVTCLRLHGQKWSGQVWKSNDLATELLKLAF